MKKSLTVRWLPSRPADPTGKRATCQKMSPNWGRSARARVCLDHRSRFFQQAGRLSEPDGWFRRSPSFYADYLDRVRAYHATAAYRKAMRKLQVWVEQFVT